MVATFILDCLKRPVVYFAGRSRWSDVGTFTANSKRECAMRISGRGDCFPGLEVGEADRIVEAVGVDIGRT